MTNWFSDLWTRLVTNYQSTATGLVVLVFTWATDHGIDVSADNQKVATAKILAIALSVLKIFGKDAPTPEDSPATGRGSGGVGPAARSWALVVLILLPLSFMQVACWGGKNATPTRKFIEQLDNNSISAREAQLSLKQLLDLNMIAPQTARSFGGKVEAFRASNRQIIDFADSPDFKQVQADGSVLITLTPAGKIELEKLAAALKTAATSIVQDKALFPNLSDSSRAIWAGFFANAEQTANLFDRLVKSLKLKSGAVSITVSADEWRRLQVVAGM